MNIQSLHYEISDGEDRQFTETNCPHGFRGTIEKAIARGQSSGNIAGAGRIWRWQSLPSESVLIELTRDGSIEQTYEVPETAWRAFELCAQRRNVEARSWLAVILADGLSRDISIAEMLRWVFPTKGSPEVERFEAAQRQFHRFE